MTIRLIYQQISVSRKADGSFVPYVLGFGAGSLQDLLSKEFVYEDFI